MALIRIALADGREEAVRSYSFAGDRVRALKVDGSVIDLAIEAVDKDRTFAANAGTDFEPPAAFPASGEPALELVEHRERNAGDYIVVEGVVRNLTRVDFGNVVAKVLGEDEDGSLLTSEEALVDWSPLRGGAETPFKVVVRSGGRVRRTRLVFRSLLGDQIPTRGLEAEPKA